MRCVLSWDKPAEWFPLGKHEAVGDWRHCALLYEIAKHPDIRTVVEIGSFAGHSASGFVQLIDKKELDYLLCVDTTPQDSLREILGTRDNVRLDVSDSLECRRYMFDMAFLDGDHTHPHVLHEWYAVERDAKVVALHDSAYAHRHPQSNGPMICKQHIMATGGWVCFEDSLFRTGERTDRGMFIAVRAEMQDLVRYTRDLYKSACL